MGNVLGKVIRSARKELHWKVYKLADKIEVIPEFITLIEQGKRLPSEEVLAKLMGVLKVDLYPLYISEKHPAMLPYIKPDIMIEVGRAKEIVLIEAKNTKANKGELSEQVKFYLKKLKNNYSRRIK